MALGFQTQSDFEAEIEVPAGTDAYYGFAVAPLDLTGTTAVMVTDFGTFPVVLTVDLEGDVAVTTLATAIPNASLPAPGVYKWRILVTWPYSPPFVLQYGHGAFYVRGS